MCDYNIYACNLPDEHSKNDTSIKAAFEITVTGDFFTSDL